MANFLLAIPTSILFKKPMNVAIGEQVGGYEISLYAPQSRLEILWRTLISDRFRGQHPAPDSCGQAYKISCRRYLSNLHANIVRSITKGEDYETKWAHVLDENDAFASMLIPGKMKSIASCSQEIIRSRRRDEITDLQFSVSSLPKQTLAKPSS
jgi:hypothetical protein